MTVKRLMNKSILLNVLTFIVFSFSAFGEQNSTSMHIAGLDFKLKTESEEFDLYFYDQNYSSGVLEFVIGLRAKKGKLTPPLLLLQWQTPSHDIAGMWTPQYNNDLVIPADWSSKGLESMLTQNAPVYLLFGHDDINRYTVSIGDALNAVKLSSKVREEDSLIYNEIEFFAEQHPSISQFETLVRIDMRKVPFYEALKSVSEWWAGMDRYQPTKVPEAATEPMYSTWYSYHQNITHEELVEEAKLAASIGYEAIIVDDGWQTNDSNRGYAFTGDWEPERLVDMEGFVNDIHALDMKALLWYSIPFVGEKSKASAKFQGKYLKHLDSLETYVLDPRYPEVREFLIAHYVKAVKKWGWDGLKLDFIDQFRTQSDTVLEAADGRDYASVYKAVDVLMSDLIARLKEVNPDVMVEFRQKYIGPAMKKYGNMFRATDIPNGAVTNRRRVIDLRLLSGDTAVHSDMLMWHYDEPVEIAALQLLNVFFSVPQLSMRLAELPPEHIQMVRHYTNYWKKNKQVLLTGDFQPKGIFSGYPVITSSRGAKSITVLYDEQYLHIDNNNLASVDIINAKKSNSIVVKLPVGWSSFKYTIIDVTGSTIGSGEAVNNGGFNEMNVPVSGMIMLQKN